MIDTFDTDFLPFSRIKVAQETHAQKYLETKTFDSIRLVLKTGLFLNHYNHLYKGP